LINEAFWDRDVTMACNQEIPIDRFDN
jgi:hypothetical protein